MINLKATELSGISTAARSANTQTKTKTKRHVSAWCLEIRDGPILEMRAARHVAAMAARNKTSSPEARIPSIIHKTNGSSLKKKSRNLRQETAAAKAA